jgi:hypothetical protein
VLAALEAAAAGEAVALPEDASAETVRVVGQLLPYAGLVGKVARGQAEGYDPPSGEDAEGGEVLETTRAEPAELPLPPADAGIPMESAQSPFSWEPPPTAAGALPRPVRVRAAGADLRVQVGGVFRHGRRVLAR